MAFSARDSKLFVYTGAGTKRGFAEWVETALADAQIYHAHEWGGDVSSHIHRWSPQLDWITADGELAVDFVARLERLPNDFAFVCERLGLPHVRLPHRNRRLHWHYSHYYDRTTRELVAAYYARDIEEFDYEFEDSLLRLSLAWPFRALRENTSATAAAESAPARDVIDLDASPRSRSWFSRASLALAAGFALFLGAWTVSPLAAFSAPATDPSTASAPIANVNRVVVQNILRTLPREPETSLARRFARTFANFQIVPQPPPAPPMILSLESEGSSTAPAPAPARRNGSHVATWSRHRASDDPFVEETPRPRVRLNFLNRQDR